MTSRILGPELVFNPYSRVVGNVVVVTKQRTNYGAMRSALYTAIQAIDPSVSKDAPFLEFTVGGWQIRLVSDQLIPKQYRSHGPDITRYTSLALKATRQGRNTKIGRPTMTRLLPELACKLAGSIPMLLEPRS